MAGISDNEARPPASPDGPPLDQAASSGQAAPEHAAAGAHAASPEVIEGIRALHGRLDELQRLIGQRLSAEGMEADEWLRERAGPARPLTALPAWRRRTEGELRWPVTVTLCGVAALQTFVPGKLQLVKPAWALPAAMGVLMAVLITANPQRIDRQSRFMRSTSLVLGALLTLANGWSVGRLTVEITQGKMGQDASQLLVTGALIWITNVSVFALWYWEFDRGGPAARALNAGNRLPDFQFPQMVSPPEMVSKDWEPIFVDYLYLAFTNATAFSPTDVMPMSRWAKAAMTTQSVISIITLALVISRAVNIFPSS
jgi:hypothetical protein